MSKRKAVEDMVQKIAEEAKGDAAAEIAALRSKVEQLMSEHVTPAIARAADRAEQMAGDAMDGLRSQAQRVSDTVQEKPVLALAAAAVAGAVLALLIRR